MFTAVQDVPFTYVRKLPKAINELYVEIIFTATLVTH